MWYKKIKVSASINPNIGITDFIVVLYVYNVSLLHAVYKELAASGSTTTPLCLESLKWNKKWRSYFIDQPSSVLSCWQAGCSCPDAQCLHTHFGAEGATHWIKRVLIDKVVEGKSAPTNCLSNALINQSGAAPVTGGPVSRSATGSPLATHLPAWCLLPLCQAPLSEDYRSTGHPSVRCTPAFCQTGSDRPLPLGRPQRPI